MANQDNQYNDIRQPEQRYDPVPQDPRISVTEVRDSDEPRQGTFHVKQLAQIASLVVVLVLVFGFSFYMYSTQFTTGSRADTDRGPGTVPEAEIILTEDITDYPSFYNDTPIPEKLITEAELLYNNTDPLLRKPYIINRIVLYYVLSDKVNGQVIIPSSFRALEREIPSLISRAENSGIAWQFEVQESLRSFN
ncbi:MAG: hypothetical protein ACOCXQ_01245 [Patescibacteria group bacterium]